ncbi:glycosyltransferase family 4 protein [Pseudonocardia sp. CA-107938]|uniref:glycosyltransferase family 4 protein n=1 Tax=Pseudonocardia sp. CA-107938 TaxID=3240021 RepID=UPI003D8F0C6E
MRDLHVVVPADIDDPTLPSGGNAYDRRVCRELAAAGVSVREVAVAGAWPRPERPARASLARALAALPDGAAVLLDGLVACGVPDVIVPEAGRLVLVALVHLPLGEEDATLASFEREVLHAVDAVVATSPWTARRLVAAHGLPAGRVHVATPGVDPAPLAPGSGGAGLLCLGSLTPTKGQDLLVDALAAVADRSWTCGLVGAVGRDPEYVAAVRGAISAHGLDGRVEITGPLVGDALEATFAAADLLVQPSRVEAYGMVVTEALARGIPVLAADVGGMPEILGDQDVPGILVPPGDVDALAAALRRWLDEPGLQAELRQAAALRRPTLDGWEVTARCLAQVMASARPGTPA